MAKFRDIKSPVALAAVGAFMVPEPLGTCLIAAAIIWWLARKLGLPLHLLSRLPSPLTWLLTWLPSWLPSWPRELGARLMRLSVALGSLLKSQRADVGALPMTDIEAHAILSQLRARDLV
jgi:hypothetical protein